MGNNEETSQERRKYTRIKKNFIISYHDKLSPSVKYEVSQIKNISLGGSCFITSNSYSPATKIGIELKTPFLAGTVHLEGSVLESKEKVPNLVYETRLIFAPLTPQADFVLKKIVEYFKEGKRTAHE